MDADFQRYLRAKRTVDDRSLDRRLLDRLQSELRTRDRPGPLRILEVGAGVGTMVERLLEWDLLPPGERVEYTALDVDPANVRTIRDRLPAWASDRGIDAALADGTVTLDGSTRVVVDPVVADATDFVPAADREWDLLVGAAVLDIIGLDALLALLSGLGEGGCWYFPITFDGGTRFAPTHSADDTVEAAYHQHMDEKPGGDSRAGQHALERLGQSTATRVLGVAGSDWAVYPVDGEYPGDEAYFLRYVLDTIERSLSELEGGPDEETLAAWLERRRRQIDRGELTYLTHQLDLLGRVGPSRQPE